MFVGGQRHRTADQPLEKTSFSFTLSSYPSSFSQEGLIRQGGSVSVGGCACQDTLDLHTFPSGKAASPFLLLF